MLSDEQAEQIRADIERSSLSFPMVKDDLLDHFCCVVESKLEQGHSFEDAYYLAWQQICPNGLDEIQEETIYLLNASKIIVMKKVMRIKGIKLVQSKQLLFYRIRARAALYRSVP
jgi:hypothetical protein